ncbi:uncharacterized protein LOC131666403 [Phymastichus coffea]|uniref:uncharacterized protein LOC131666403 n=1 Tax=Phymastichus coffea TaxID=108790 RepID=UPI00273BE27F|nr:uncharacterized protein LOC131666403 [Phymastichus coffea]
MNIADFKTEFSMLLNRFAIITSPTDESSKGSSQNHRELLNAVQDTLRTVLNVKLQYLEEAALTTPVNNEIVVATPHAPDVLRMDYNQTTRYEAGLTRCAEIKLADFVGLHTHHEERMEVSDNEIFTDNANDNNNKDAKNANLPVTSVQMERQGDFHQKLALGVIVEETQRNLRKVVSNLQRMEDILAPASRSEPHALRRITAMLNASATKKPALGQSHHHILSLRSTIQRAKAARRSLASVTDDVVTTPTTSRPTHISQPMTAMKKPSGPSSTISKITQHSLGMSSFTADKSKSPVKPTKNPKYAHVQSTIPKAVVAKKKTTT